MSLRKKCMYSLLTNAVILLIGMVLLIFPSLVADDINTTFYTIMYIIAAIKFCEYFLTKDPGDYEHLWVALASTLAGTSGVIFNLETTSMVLSLTLICWVAMVSVIKLIKIDYLMDRKNKMWYAEIVIFITFLLTGILTSINLYYEITVQALMLGFFFFIIGLLEMSFPLLNMLQNKLDRETQKAISKEIEKREKESKVKVKVDSKKVESKTKTTKKEVKVAPKKVVKSTKKEPVKKVQPNTNSKKENLAKNPKKVESKTKTTKK